MKKNKERIKKKIVQFAKREYRKSSIVPSARKIDREFRISFWSYFPKGMNMFYKLCGFNFSPKENKQKSRRKFYLQKRNRIRKEILKYFIQQIKKGINPTSTSIRERFSISLLTYFPGGIRELYKITKTNPPISLRDREESQQEIIKYIQLQVKNGFYPTRDQINEKFHTNIKNSIRKLYKLAEVEYKRDPNPFLRYRKEKKLVDIALKLFPKLGYRIKRISSGPSKPSGADIVVEDKEKNLIPVEIKAYQKFGKLGWAKYSPYQGDEILQIKRYIKNLHASYGYLITSTDRKAFKAIPANIKILFGKDLRKLLLQFKMYKEIKDLDWIRNSSVSYGKEQIYKKIREKILKYVRKKIKQEKYVSYDEIMDKFKMHVESYFPGGMREIYKKFNMDVELIPNYRMGRKFNKKKFRERIIAYAEEENEKGHFPTYRKIQRKFRCLPKLYFLGGIREIAKLAKIKYSRKFANKTPEEKEIIKQKIIKYTKEKLQKGYYPGYRDFRKDLLVSPLNYFKNIEEIYQNAGYNGPVKKTWKNSSNKINVF